MLGAYAAVEVALSAWDAYDTYQTITSDCSTTGEKWTSGGLFAAGVFLPGNYGWLDNAVKGGRYRQVRNANIGGEVHHMPANSVNGLPHSKGPSIHMEKADHRKTGSHGHQGLAGAQYRARQKELIDSRRFDDAIQMDIDDIQNKFGNKYDSAILQMIDSLD